MPPFKLVAPYQPAGDQPQAITQLSDGLNKHFQNQILLGVTGSGKTFSLASIIQNVQRPTLVMAPNKTLAAQLFSEFREFFPENSVQYFVSYYDYYQPEAYLPGSDTYIEKDSSINAEIEKFRHASTHSILTRRDTIIVASVSCIYGLGSPEVYRQANLCLKVGQNISRSFLTRRLGNIQYERNDLDLKRGCFRVQGDTLTIFPAYEDYQIKLSQFGDELETIQLIHPQTGATFEKLSFIEIYPAKHYLTPDSTVTQNILQEIRQDLEKETKQFIDKGKLLEAQRLKERTRFDLEMIAQTGSTSGIENYSRYFDQRQIGTPPSVLLDYFPRDFLLFIDESHMTVPQIGAMFNGDQARKQTLVDYGFRLQAAKDNRPLKFSEFKERIGQTIYVSATPGKYELELVKTASQIGKSHPLIAEQLVRPTGILDPEIEIRSSKCQIEDILREINQRSQKNQRVLITTLTKRMAEDIAEYLQEKEIKVQYLHSDIKTLKRSEILHDLRLGTFEVVIGINLLREGLDLPEVSLIIILDADKEGFLRSETALIQTIGRAARHLEGKVIMYANKITGSMQRAIEETKRRRFSQIAYNKANHLEPVALSKPLNPKLDLKNNLPEISLYQKMKPIQKAFYRDMLREQMRQAALNLNYEEAARLRDRLKELSL